MIATSKSTIHQAVVTLIVRTGTGRLEAERQWDNIYSRQYDRAEPGRKVTWHIGEYTFEFTKQAQTQPQRDPLELIAQAHTEAQQAETSSRLRGWLQALALLVLIVAGYIYFF